MNTEASVKPAVKVDELVSAYIKLRDKKAKMTADFKDSVAPIDDAMARCEAFLLSTLNAMGLESTRTPYGTAYTTTAVSATVADWPLVLDYVKKNELWPMLEKRVSKDFVRAFKAEHNDIPPGINWTETRVLNIRRSP